jgi:antirestriction protein ArdC
MARYDRSARTGADRTNLYDDITNKIIAELEQGRLPWVQPWGASPNTAPLGLPKNASTGRTYSGINILILWGAVIQHGFPGQSWLTFRQALSLGGNVMKGERGTTVVYADRFTPEDEKRRARETGDDAQSIPFLKRFTVFNAAQCEGLPDDIAIVAISWWSRRHKPISSRSTGTGRRFTKSVTPAVITAVSTGISPALSARRNTPSRR